MQYKTADHPEANGRKPVIGEQEYYFSFITEAGDIIEIRMGQAGWEHHSQHVLDMLLGTESYNDGSMPL